MDPDLKICNPMKCKTSFGRSDFQQSLGRQSDLPADRISNNVLAG